MASQVNLLEISTHLKSLIQDQADDKELEWFHHQEEKLRHNFRLNALFLAFNSVSRFIGKRTLELTREQIVKSTEVRTGFQPEYWDLRQCVRIYFLLQLPIEDAISYERKLNGLSDTADMDEQVSLYKALPLLPFPEVMIKRATEGIRTNITDVFDAIALHNPYPSEFLDQGAWNQMLLKAVFMQRPLYRIYGADQRANPELREMLMDFAHERWAANRDVMPELWRFVGPFLTTTDISDIEKAIGGSSLERQAGLLACSLSELPMAEDLLNQYPEIKEEIRTGRLNWTLIGEKFADV